MKELSLRTWHRRAGIVFVVFVGLQVISGVFLDLTWFITPHDFIGRLGVQDLRTLSNVQKGWGRMLEIAHFIHLGGLTEGAIYRTILAMGLLFLSGTGILIFREACDPKSRKQFDRQRG
jgi:hypothetical protein